MQVKQEKKRGEKPLWTLFFSMLKIGLFTFGGGYAMLALFEAEFVARKKWIAKDEFLDMVAIAESTPGPLAINGATYIGYKVAGVFGSLAATAAVCIPSFAIISIISLFFDRFLALPYVAYAFQGIRVCVVWLILSAGLKLFCELKKNALNVVLLVTVLGSMIGCSLFAVDFSSILAILLCGAVGLSVYLLSRLRGKGGAKK